MRKLGGQCHILGKNISNKACSSPLVVGIEAFSIFPILGNRFPFVDVSMFVRSGLDWMTCTLHLYQAWDLWQQKTISINRKTCSIYCHVTSMALFGHDFACGSTNNVMFILMTMDADIFPCRSRGFAERTAMMAMLAQGSNLVSSSFGKTGDSFRVGSTCKPIFPMN